MSDACMYQMTLYLI